ncbi:glycoside hydrolase family 13 protein [Salinibacter grassmerensis]|uniref:glycoside hydrolase family 13 protein n=1 Tax=Salinibacter grassmerensis TaxID=3040353 RepID=UPI0021E75DD9|nr:glycoside hydrolase family 13 protein [Salinibacter grassmerensis]
MGGVYGSVYDRRYGGDLQGVIGRLPYLNSLGVTALYFNPVFSARSLHKYDGSSYHHIDPNFGPDPSGDRQLIAQEDPTNPSTWRTTAADSLFFALVEKAHARDLRVIIDGVFNHTGRDFFAFADLVEDQAESRYADWYAVSSFDDPAMSDTSEFDYTGWWGVASLPEFANNEAGTNLQSGPKQYILDATERWMDPNGNGDPSDGVDGWRLDVAEEVPVGFWQEWNAHVRDLSPAAYTVPEVWEDASGYLEKGGFEKGGFSATMNYHGFACPVKGFLVDRAIELSRFAELLREPRAAYPPRVRRGLQNLIGSHDTPRLATMVVNRADTGYAQPERFDYDNGAIVDVRQNPDYKVRAPTASERRLQRLAVLFQMTYVGAPMVYHGDEAGMWGAYDPDDRKPMVWPDKTCDVEDNHPYGHDRPADPVAFNDDLFATYRDLIALRRDHEALRRGPTPAGRDRTASGGPGPHRGGPASRYVGGRGKKKAPRFRYVRSCLSAPGHGSQDGVEDPLHVGTHRGGERHRRVPYLETGPVLLGHRQERLLRQVHPSRAHLVLAGTADVLDGKSLVPQRKPDGVRPADADEGEGPAGAGRAFDADGPGRHVVVQDVGRNREGHFLPGI